MGTKTRTIANNLTTNLGEADVIKLTSASAVSQTGITEIEISLPETYKQHIINFYAKPETDDAELRAQLSADGGSSYYSSTNNYTHCTSYVYANNGHDPYAADGVTSGGDSLIKLTRGLGNNTANGEGVKIQLNHYPLPYESSNNSVNTLHFNSTRKESDNSTVSGYGVATLEATYVLRTNYIKIYMSSGNIEDYAYEVYGVK